MPWSAPSSPTTTMSSPVPGPVDKAVDNERSPPPSPNVVEEPHASASSADQLEAIMDSDASCSDGDVIDMKTFRQILELDEDDTLEFSAETAWAYFKQAGTTFTKMDEALVAKDLAELSSLGHFLKGSSAALGVAKVQASCERMQHYGQRRDEKAGISLSEEEALSKIETLLVQVKREYNVAEERLKEWYREHGVVREDA